MRFWAGLDGNRWTGLQIPHEGGLSFCLSTVFSIMAMHGSVSGRASRHSCIIL